jgi:hypothetical protein
MEVYQIQNDKFLIRIVVPLVQMWDTICKIVVVFETWIFLINVAGIARNALTSV